MPKAIDKETAAELKRFSELPDEAYVRAPVVQALFDIKKTTLYTAVGDYIPMPKRFGKRNVAWNVGQLRRALAS